MQKRIAKYLALVLVIATVTSCGISAGTINTLRTERGASSGWSADIDAEFFNEFTISIAYTYAEDTTNNDSLLLMVMLPDNSETFAGNINDFRFALALRSGIGDAWGFGAGWGYKAGLESKDFQIWCRPMIMLWLGEHNDAFDPAVELNLQTGIGFVF